MLQAAVLTICMVTPQAKAADQMRNYEQDYRRISQKGVLYFRQQHYEDASGMFEKAARLAESAKLSPEKICNSYLNLAAARKESKDYIGAQRYLDKSALLMQQFSLSSPALHMRLLRRQVDVYEITNKFAAAAEVQYKMCELYRNSIGKLVMSNFSEMARLQHLQLRANQFKQSIYTGSKLLALLTEFKIQKDSDINIRASLTQGLSLMHTANVAQGKKYLVAVYGWAKSGSPDFACYAAAWLVLSARAAHDKLSETSWFKNLEATAPSTDRPAAKWLDEVQQSFAQAQRDSASN